ncbi:hypothetical protein PILCRDRAFT_822083 [Piloderma croceum F 1598]|uniref:Prokaryotic-type class I peptide chain release factors domain-containing protein n=1 Tax=Piloderma croceum (strain F 1598) TaxID=765440 RepID=A0A0C3FM14_PILCF|nr:hypothetical protein PILCRDRAFT_822083 [Piloderma croceum F 1598]
MSITPALRAAARAAYRDLLRASSATFADDERVLTAFRLKIRTDALEAQSESDSNAYAEKVKLGHEIATILRRNVVQAHKVQAGQTEDNKELWRIQLRKDTEMGDNDSIKTPQPCEANSRRARKQEKAASNSAEADGQPPKPVVPRNYSALKRAHKERTPPELNEDDLEEAFVRGSGPGGQSINKTSNNVQLLHKPSGIRVTCQITRSLETNRKLARRILLEKLDKIENPGLSKGELMRAKQHERERRRRKKAKKKSLEKEREQVFGSRVP